MERLIQEARAKKASDLHLKAGQPPLVRVDGALTPLRPEVLSREDCDRLCSQLLEGDVPSGGDVDLAKTVAGCRLRVNLFRAQSGLCAAIRLLSDQIPQLESLGLPPAALELKNLARGIVLVTGQTGSGD